MHTLPSRMDIWLRILIRAGVGLLGVAVYAAARLRIETAGLFLGLMAIQLFIAEITD